MARLHLKYGFVAEGDRLSSSADSLAVTEPATGSRSRTKGNLYVVVSSAARGARSRDATVLVADTIRREYYYDESAGIPICLEKAFRSAERKLRNGRGGQTAAAGSIGVAVAVIRGTELYVATTGPVEAYLVRAARLLMPEHARGPGIPIGEDLRVGVWRGEFSIGDSLLLVARDLTEVVGTEELKNAVVTLHPQSAVEHLHHLFVAAGGEGSDAVLAIEASEAASPRNEHRLVPVATPEGAPGMPEHVTAGGGSVTSAFATRAVDAREAMGNAVASLGERLGDLVPGRRRQYRPLTPRVSQREAQRRAAVAFLAFLGVILVVGLAVAFFPPGREDAVDRINAGEAAFISARDLADQGSELIVDDPSRARDLLRQAWQAAVRAQETGVPAAQVGPLRERIASGLDTIYGSTRMAVSIVTRVDTAATPQDPRDLILGPDGAAYVLDEEARTVTRIDLASGTSVVVVTAGDGGGAGIGTPEMLAVGATDLLIVDDREGLWRWRPSDDTGRGTLGQIVVGGEVAWGDDIIDVGTFLQPGQAEDGLYNLYVADPSSSQILRYQPTQDGGSFPTQSSYLVADDAAVAQFRELLIDGDIYALTATDARRYETGQQREFVLEVPPDDGDVRPGREFALIESTGPRREGSLYVWDALHGRLVVYDKSDGSYVQQWLPVSSAPALSDLRGMFIVVEQAPVVPEGSVVPEPSPPITSAGTLYWLTADALYRSELTAVEDEPAATPSPSVGPAETVEPAETVDPTRSVEPTRRPRRTPRVTP